MPLLVNHTKAVLLPVYYLYSYPSPDRISTERGSKTNRAAVVPEIINSSYRCHIQYNSSLTRASSFATGRGSPYYLRRRLTSTHITDAQARFLCFRNVMFNGITTCLFHPWLISWPSSIITSTAPNFLSIVSNRGDSNSQYYHFY